MHSDSRGLQIGQRGELPDGSWATFDLDFARVRERLYDIAGSLHHVAQDGELPEPRRLLDAYESTAPEPLTRDEHRWLPGAEPRTPALGCHRRARGRRHPRGRERNDRRRGLVVAPG